MPPVRPAAHAATKWHRAATAAAQSYAEGVQNPSVGQAEAAAAAEGVYESAVQAAIGRKAFGQGVRAAGTDKWKKHALEKGVTRFPQGVAVSEPLYAQAVSPFFDTIQATSLPPRGATGDPRNLDRVRVMSQALRHKKTGGKM